MDKKCNFCIYIRLSICDIRCSDLHFVYRLRSIQDDLFAPWFICDIMFLHTFFNFSKQLPTSTNRHTHQGTRRCLKVYPVCAESSWKEEGSSSWQAHCSRSIQDCFYCCLWTPPLHCVILSFTELCSFVVHLLCCVGSINLISSLFSPITNSQLLLCQVLHSMSAHPEQLLSFQHYPAGPSVSWENRFDESM